MDQTRREYNKKVLDRIASDPKFREEILDDPKGAIERAGLKWEGDEDVTGYLFLGPLPPVSGGSGGTSSLATALCDPGVEKEPPGKLPPPITDPLPPVNQ